MDDGDDQNSIESDVKGCSRFLFNISEYNALICSLAFLFVFASFGTAQNFATSNNGNTGATSLAILYGVFTISNLLAPKIISKISMRLGMFYGAVTYTLYVAANIKLIDIALYGASALMGTGAAMIWVGQGAFITKCSNYFEQKRGLNLNSKIGYFNGIFWCIYIFNQVIGNLTAALLFYYDVPTQNVYIVLTGFGVLGTFIFLLIRPFPAQTSVEEGLLKDDIPKETNEVSIYSAMKLAITPTMSKVILIIFYSGLSQGFEYGDFPAKINSDDKKFFAMSIFGVIDGICSQLFGWWSDKIGRLPILLIATLCHSIVYIIFFLYDIDSDKYIGIYFVLAGLLGIGDAGFNTQLYALMPKLFVNNPQSDVFANFKFFQSISTTAAFIVYGLLSNHWKLKIVIWFGCMILGMAAIVIFPDVRRVASERRSKTMNLVDENNANDKVQ